MRERERGSNRKGEGEREGEGEGEGEREKGVRADCIVHVRCIMKHLFFLTMDSL